MKHLLFPISNSWLRNIAILAGVVLLIWLSIESVSESWAVILGVVICVMVGIQIGNRFLMAPNDQLGNDVGLGRKRFMLSVTIGILIGFMVSPLAVFLMVFKNGLHGHTMPDYTVPQIVAVLKQTPWIVLGGIFLGVGFGFWQLSRDGK